MKMRVNFAITYLLSSKKSALGTTLSQNCWTMKMDDSNGPWYKLTLKVGRRFPTLVSVGNKVMM
jgi:hypothetical protein